MRRIVPIVAALAVVGAACDAAAPSVERGGGVTVPPTATTVPAPQTTAPPDAPATAPARTTAPPLQTTAPPDAPTTVTSTLPVELRLEEVASGFDQPVFLTSPPRDGRRFVVDQPGLVWVLAGADPEVFLDIRSDVGFGGERGLLGLAFHPEYAANGLFYVNYTARSGATRIVEFTVSDDPDRANADSARLVLEIDQPAPNHNGGMVAFGPDGNLWIGMGDGGAANDRFDNGQRPDTLLGAMLRITVGPGVTAPYATPADNPFAATGGAPEVWAIGLRNPWRFDFDGDRLYIADVGQQRVEEIDVVSLDDARRNFGWPLLEGNTCFSVNPCEFDDLVPAALTYGHGEGCSITGGVVYRGEALPGLDGHYFYGDYCAGWIRSVLVAPDAELGGPARPAVAAAREWFAPGTVPNLTSFGVDAAGELYVLSASGSVFRVVAL